MSKYIDRNEITENECKCENSSNRSTFYRDYDPDHEKVCNFGEFHWHCNDCNKIIEQINIDLNNDKFKEPRILTIRRGTYDKGRFGSDNPNYRTGYEIYYNRKYFEYYEIIEKLQNLVKICGNKKEDIYQFVQEIHGYKFVLENFILLKEFMIKYLRKKIIPIANFWIFRTDNRKIIGLTAENLEIIACYLACLFIAEEYYLYKESIYAPGSLYLLDAIRDAVINGTNPKVAVNRFKGMRGAQFNIRMELVI